MHCQFRIAKSRLAFTLVELLVVIAIIGVLVGLLLPAVQAAREAARRTHCQNGIRQIALSAINYESAYKMLPGFGGESAPAGVVFKSPVTVTESQRGVPWMIQILPFMEQPALYSSILDITLKTTKDQLLNDQQKLVAQMTVPQYYCTSRRSARAYPLVGRYIDKFGATGARTDYAMCGGAAELVEEGGATVNHLGDGVWVTGTRVRLKTIRDGLSNTILVGEKAMNKNKTKDGTCYGDRSPIMGWSESYGTPNSYVRFAARGTSVDLRDSCLACHDFGSAHYSGWNTAFGDGSVKSVNYFLDLKVLRAHATTDGGEVATLDN